MKFFKLIECTPEEIADIKQAGVTPHVVVLTNTELHQLFSHLRNQAELSHSETSVLGTCAAFNLFRLRYELVSGP